MANNILAVDLGGTKTHLRLYGLGESQKPEMIREGILPSRQYPGLENLVLEFLATGQEKVEAACFGLSGPVVNGRARIVNLPWEVDQERISESIGCPRVRLMNDLETTAIGALHLSAHEFHCLNPGESHPGNKAVIAAGTGLGQAFLFWDGEQHRAAATEGGHADFSPQTEFQYGLLRFLQRKYAHVSWEHILSGAGLHELYCYLIEELGRSPNPETAQRLEEEDPGSVIGSMAVAGKCPVCLEAVDHFVEAYGAQAGNLALTVFALGGVYVGGGIAVKLLPRMVSGKFLSAFYHKERFEGFMARIPVHIILNPQASVIGAAHIAASLLFHGR